MPCDKNEHWEKMKLLGFLFCALNLLAQAQEIVTLRAIEYTKERHEHWLGVATTDTGSFYTELLGDLKNNRASDAEVLSIAVNSGKKSTIEAIQEIVYSTEYEPPDLPSQQSIGGLSEFKPREEPKVPIGFQNLLNSFQLQPIPNTFEPRNTGSTLEVSSEGHSNNSYSIWLDYEIVRLIGWDKFSSSALRKGLNYGDYPRFVCRRLNIALTVKESTWQFIGFRDAWGETSPEGAKVAFFVRVDAIR